MMAVDQASDLLTIKEAAAALKVSPITIKRYLKQGRLPAYQVGPRAIRIRRDDLERVLTPTQKGSVAPMKRESALSARARLNEEDIERRKAIVAKILANREERNIAPLTTAELVRQSREEGTWYGE
jgi:excisionase family DNA binding protein